MDPLEAAGRLPHLAQRSMRDAVCAYLGVAGRAPARRLIDSALIRMDRWLERGESAPGLAPLVFAERDRVVREMGTFLASRLASRLFALAPGRVMAGAHAAPFDAIVGSRAGAFYGIVMRRLEANASRLQTYQRVRSAALACDRDIAAVVVYDWSSGATRVVSAARRGDRLREAGAKRHDRDLRARRKMQFGENMRDVILDGLVA
jgi:hypothetical protein